VNWYLRTPQDGYSRTRATTREKIAKLQEDSLAYEKMCGFDILDLTMMNRRGVQITRKKGPVQMMNDLGKLQYAVTNKATKS
jgi:hypothetical protein